jgi:hypothetical protein
MLKSDFDHFGFEDNNLIQIWENIGSKKFSL